MRFQRFEDPQQQQAQSRDSLTAVTASVLWICHPEDSWQKWHPSAGLADTVARPPVLCRQTVEHVNKQHGPLKCCYLTISLCGITTEETT